MAETFDIEKTRPIRVLESRREALLRWLAEGRAAILEAEASIRKNQEDSLEFVAEIDEIEAALNALYAEQNKVKEDIDGGT